MDTFIQFLLHLLVISAFLLIFVLATVFVRPFMIHRKRMISTMILKIGYLVYLFVLLSFFYFLIFIDKDLSEFITDLHFIILLLTLFIPSTGMLLRRRFRKTRSFYNYILTAIHLGTIIYLALLFYQIQLLF